MRSEDGSHFTVYLQATIIHYLDDGPDASLIELRGGSSGKGAVSEKDGAIVGFYTASVSERPNMCNRTAARRLGKQTAAQLLEW